MSVNALTAQRLGRRPMDRPSHADRLARHLLVSPTIGFGWIHSWHNEQRAVQVVLLCASTLPFALFALFRPDALAGSRRTYWLVFVFLAIGLVSALRSPHLLAAFAEVALFGLLLAVAALTAAVAADHPERATLWARYFALVCAAGYVLGVAVRLFAAIEIGRGPDLDVLILGYANPRFPSALHAVLIPFVALSAVDSGERRAIRLGSAVVLVGLWFINWGLGTRGIWLAYLLAVPATIALTGWSRTRAMTATLIATALLGVLSFELVRHWSARFP